MLTTAVCVVNTLIHSDYKRKLGSESLQHFLCTYLIALFPFAIFPFLCLLAFLGNLLLIISNVFTDCEALGNLLLKSAIQTKTKEDYSLRYFVIVSLNVKSILLELA